MKLRILVVVRFLRADTTEHHCFAFFYQDQSDMLAKLLCLIVFGRLP